MSGNLGPCPIDYCLFKKKVCKFPCLKMSLTQHSKTRVSYYYDGECADYINNCVLFIVFKVMLETTTMGKAIP